MNKMKCQICKQEGLDQEMVDGRCQECILDSIFNKNRILGEYEESK